MALPPQRIGVDRFTFGTFQVSPGNRAAFEACCDIANLRMTAPQPIVLVGPHYSGKTHLLYAIANRLRQADRPVGLVCVSAQRFPDEARRLIEDPAALARARRAVLLVDQLDHFDDDACGTLILRFVEAGHAVVATSQSKPDALLNCSATLRDLLAAGSVFELDARPANGNGAKPNGSHSAHKGVTRVVSAPVMRNLPDAEPWGVVREELGRAYRELRWALDEVERLRQVNDNMSQHAQRSLPGTGTQSAALLAQAEHALDELYSNRRQIEELRAAEAKDLETLRALSERSHAQPVSELTEINENLARALDSSRRECTELRAKLEAARAELDSMRSRDRNDNPSLSEPLTELENAARGDTDEPVTRENPVAREKPRFVPRPGSSLYHVEQLGGEADLLDDEPDEPESEGAV